MSPIVTTKPPNRDLKHSGTFDEFILWYAMPTAQKKVMQMETMEQFADGHGINRKTLTRWKDRPEFKPRVRDLRDKWAFEKSQEVIEAIYKSAIRGNDKSQKLWMQVFEGFSERTENVQTTRVELTVNDLRFLIQGFTPEEQDKYYGYIREIIDRAAITASEIERGEIPADLRYVEAGATDSAEEPEGSLSDEADIDAQHLQGERADEVSSSNQKCLCKNMERKVSAYHHQSSARGWEIETARDIRLRRLVSQTTQGCQHGRISSASNDSL